MGGWVDSANLGVATRFDGKSFVPFGMLARGTKGGTKVGRELRLVGSATERRRPQWSRECVATGNLCHIGTRGHFL